MFRADHKVSFHLVVSWCAQVKALGHGQHTVDMCTSCPFLGRGPMRPSGAPQDCKTHYYYLRWALPNHPNISNNNKPRPTVATQSVLVHRAKRRCPDQAAAYVWSGGASVNAKQPACPHAEAPACMGLSVRLRDGDVGCFKAAARVGGVGDAGRVCTHTDVAAYGAELPARRSQALCCCPAASGYKCCLRQVAKPKAVHASGHHAGSATRAQCGSRPPHRKRQPSQPPDPTLCHT